MSVPGLDELLERFKRLLDDEDLKPHYEAFEAYFSGVASGASKPLLTLQNAVVAAQTVLVVVEHVKQNGPAYSSQGILEIVKRSGMDLSPCRLCGKPVICLPDGLALCRACAEKDGG